MKNREKVFLRKPKRSGFTLLEILVSISIASILFIVLFSKIREFASLRKQLKQVESECLERQLCQIRLQELFSLLLVSDKEKQDRSFYTQQNSLVFQIQQTIDADPAFLGNLDCTMQFDPASGHLYLVTKNASGQERRELLVKGLLNCSMRFFSTKEKTWLNDWSQKNADLPAFFSIKCSKTFGQVDYLFAIDASTPQLQS